MKTKYTFIALMISIFSLTLEAANTFTIDQNYTISLTTGYVNSMSETWNVVSTVTDKPIIITYSIGTENNYDFLTINNVDNSGNVTSQLLRISGTKSGIVSTTIPNGRAQVVFTSDGSVCYASKPSVYSGINVTFSVNPNQIVGNGLFVNGNSYISGNVGIGKNPPQAQLDVTGGVGGLAITGTNLDPYYSNKLLPFQNSAKLILGWNYSGGRGEQDFIANSNPTLAGGFSFYNYPYNGSAATHLMTIEASGKVGIGTPTPAAKLDVGTFLDGGILGTVMGRLQEGNTSGDGTFLGIKGYETQLGAYNGKSFSIEHNFYGVTNSSINFFRGGSSSGGYLTFNTDNNSEKMRICTNGNVLIGTTLPDPTNALLTVNGTIHAKEINVTVDIPADYVFHPSYNLMPLNQVEQFVKTNSHLPEIPSAAEITKNGLSVGEMQNKLLQKIEELTLYVIDQQKTIEAQNFRIEQLEKK